MSTSNTDTGDTLNTEINALNDEQMAAPREALITTAINFLQNAKVRHTTLTQKQQFLRSKGLTSHEIQLACERAGVFTQDPTKPQTTTAVINMGISSSAAGAAATNGQMSMMPVQQLSAYGRIKEALHSMALLSGLAYAIYMFWKKYLAPFLFGRKKRKSIDKSLEDIESKVDTRLDSVDRELSQLRNNLNEQQREQQQQFNREFNHFRSDLEAIKGLLLNRKQFAAPLNATGPAAIPAWQLQAAAAAAAAGSQSQLHHHSHHHHRDRHSQSDDNDKADDADAGSGSGSSETEVVTKNSDSSLEIM